MIRRTILALSRISLIVYIIGSFLTVLDFTNVMPALGGKYLALQLVGIENFTTEGILLIISIIVALLAVILATDKNALCLLPLSVSVFIFITHFMLKTFIESNGLKVSTVYGSGMEIMLLTSIISSALCLVVAVMPNRRDV